MKTITTTFILFFWILEALWIDWVLNNLYGFDLFALVYLIPAAIWPLFGNFLAKSNLTEEIRYAILASPFVFLFFSTLYILF
jgi:hypothetical protein